MGPAFKPKTLRNEEKTQARNEWQAIKISKKKKKNI